jgi:uncharacterized protein
MAELHALRWGAEAPCRRHTLITSRDIAHGPAAPSHSLRPAPAGRRHRRRPRGLAAAWWLGQRHDVSLFERQPRPGFTASSVAVSGSRGAGETVRIDVPLRVFYVGYYPTLSRLYRALAVRSEPVNYAASFTDGQGELYFRYRNLRVADQSFGVLAPQDLLLGGRAWRIVGGLLRFHRHALRALRRGELAGTSLGDYVARAGYPADFVEGFLLPAICTVCTCSFRHARSFPATVIVDYLARGLASESVRRALHGADDVERRLLEGIPRLHTDARIASVRRQGAGGGDAVMLQMEDGSRQRFDHVVLAAQAHQSLAMLHDARADEAAVLGAFGHAPVEVLTHGDAALMPRRRRDWSPVNLMVSPRFEAPESTIWVNAVQPALRHAEPVFQTVHPLRAPRAHTVIGHARFDRPVVDAESQSALSALQRLHAEPGRRVWFCGSYAQAGVPLLESAVRSAHEVALRLGAGSASPD